MAQSITNLYFTHHLNNFAIAFTPFAVLYGPMFYFHIKIFSREKISWFLCLQQSVFPLIVFAMYTVIIFSTNSSSDKMHMLFTLYFIVGFSMLVYGINFILKDQAKFFLELRYVCILNAFPLTLVSFSMVIGAYKVIQNDPSIKYHFFFLKIPFAILIFLFAITYFFCCFFLMTKGTYLVLPKNETNMEEDSLIEQNVFPVKPYVKSRLSERKLDEYMEILEEAMDKNKIFLLPDITLEKLANELRIPTYHLTQLLNLRLGKNFYGYLNGLRSEYALHLIKDGHLNIYDVHIRSGFGNRVSFNKYFKKLTGYTPSEYIKSSILDK
ncbi:MAG: helix-turn-helix transcriptional regulator [Sphingobacteriaceae bacterium]|nr:helix-turn-helix transcriptional regulator [Sphingobacteriaceae bacterium]